VAEKALAASKDELESTRSNYEQQMKLLSEHLATLNEKIMAQVPPPSNLVLCQRTSHSLGGARAFV
jgi:hypothetical protein